MKTNYTLTAALAAIAAFSTYATEGINLIGIGPVQQGTAGAGVASAKDSTWLILNPAGLTDVERGVDTSLEYFAPDRSLDSTVSGGAGKQTDDSVSYIPSVSASFGCCVEDRGYLGIGLYGTSGMGVDYGAGRFGADTDGDGFIDSTQDQADTSTDLSIAKLTVTYAQKFDNGFSFGVGPVFVLSLLRTDMLNAYNVAQSGEWDSSVGVGAIVGFNQKVGDKLTLGGSYMSEQYMTEFNEYSDLLNGSLNLPQQVTVGLAYQLMDSLEAVLDYRWIGWNQLDTLGDQFGWDDQKIVKAGLTWNVSDRFTLRGGISHGNSPIDSDTAFGNALFPAIMTTHLSTGFSYQFDKVRVDLAYTHALRTSETANGSDSGSYASYVSGTEISMAQDSLTLGLGWKF